MHSSPISFRGQLHQNIYGFIANLSDAQLTWQTAAWVFFALLASLTLIPCFLGKEKGFQRAISSPWLFGITAAFAILVLRAPHLVLHELNVDESQWMAGAATLWKDARFWISVDGTTSGPLVIIPINLINLLGGKISYTSVRLLALVLMIIPTALFIYRALAVFFAEAVARAGTLPLILVFATLTSSDFAAYNSEHVTFTLLAAALFFASKVINRNPERYRLNLFATGMVCGLVPYAKLQGAPAAFVIAIVAGTYFLLDNYRGKGALKIFLLYVLSGLIPTFIVLLYHVWSGAWPHFWESYILNNLAYARTGLSGNEQNLLSKFYSSYHHLTHATNLGHFFRTQRWLLLTLLLPLILACKRTPRFARPALLGSLVGFAAFYGISQPGNYFSHYFLLSLPFLLFFTGVQLAASIHLASRNQQYRSALPFLLIVFVCWTSAVPLYQLTIEKHPGIAFVEKGETLEKRSVSERINEFVAPGDPLAVWGWANYIYVETETIQASREAHTSRQIEEGTQQEYYQLRYISDLETSRPKMFVDVVGPGGFLFGERERFGHENFPVIRDYIRQNYKLLAEHTHIRLYLRKGQT